MITVIVDDEFMQSGYLEQQLIKHCPEIETIQVFNDPKDALLFLNKNKVDLIFLDIEMPGMNGFEFIEIAGLDNLPPVIFTTAFSEYAVNAFKVNAVDYLLKPVVADELITAVEKVKLRNGAQENLSVLMQMTPDPFEKRLVVMDGQRHVFIQFDNIIRIEGSGSYSIFHLINKEKITASKRLNYYWKKLDSHTFIRPHQSHIVNSKYILSYSNLNGGELILTEAHSAPVSSRLKQSIKSQLGLS
ncbi:MAG: two-component system LytT family response regulator [Crocinitomix sp.]|jgi:two-component system LytT family response regulator